MDRERESGEWREVRRRGRVVRPNRNSESNPVRQKFPSNPRTNPNLQRNPRITGREAVKWNFDLQKRRLEPERIKEWRLKKEDTHSFLFKNFPENCGLYTLLHHFQRVGDVYDVFCPGKRDREGHLFGFVRFPKHYAAEELLENLNKIWIGSFKIRVFPPRFKRENTSGARNLTKTQLPVKGGHVEENVTFVDAVNGTRNEKIDSETENVEMQFQSSADDKAWLEGSYVGFLKREFNWEEHAEELSSECGGSLIPRSMGGNLILLQKGANRSVKETIEDYDEWIMFWFEWTSPWSDLDVNNNKVVWTRWFGVPLHAWSNRFFASACAKLGLFIKLDLNSDPYSSLESARVLISTSYLVDINKVLKIRIDGRVFSIKVIEEAICSCQHKSFHQVESDEESEDQWSEEDIRLTIKSKSEGEQRKNKSSGGPAVATVKDVGDVSNSSVGFPRRISNVILEPENNNNQKTAHASISSWVPESVNVAPFLKENSVEFIGPSQMENSNYVEQAEFEMNNGPVVLSSPLQNNSNVGPSNQRESVMDQSNTDFSSGKLVVDDSGNSLFLNVKSPNTITEHSFPQKEKELRIKEPTWKDFSVLSVNDEEIPIEKKRRGSEKERKKKKNTMKTAMWRKERKKWANFVRGLASEGDSPKANITGNDGTHNPGDEDETSKRIRDEAIKTWNLGSQLGISAQGFESEMVDQLVSLEKAELMNCGKGKEKNVTVDK